VKRIVADLHIHTNFSPCASEEMVPGAIVETALERGLGVIAICDHNTTANSKRVREAASGELVVLQGMEITTCEEVHVLGLFGDDTQASTVGGAVSESLSEALGARNPGEKEDILHKGGSKPELLSSATTMSIEESVGIIRNNGGLAVAAHINRPSFSVLGHLGFIPEGVEFDAVEITGSYSCCEELFELGLPVIASSDSHSLWDIGRMCTVFELCAPTWKEIVLAMKGRDGRRCWVA
jgi:PHP family Zn ribbon phosphoesterase